jgi:hypothetical protein
MKPRNFIINYRLEGAVAIKAMSAEEAQRFFDNNFTNGLPSFVNEAEVSNDPPEEEAT